MLESIALYGGLAMLSIALVLVFAHFILHRSDEEEY